MKYVLLFALILAVIYGLYNAKKNKDIFNPVLIFALPILMSLLTNLINYDEKFHVTGGTYTVYLVSVTGFVMGVLTGGKLKIFRNESVAAPVRIGYNKRLYQLYWILAVVGIVFAARQIIKGHLYGVYGDNIIRNVRYYTQYVESAGDLGEYGIVFADTIMLWLLYKIFVQGDSKPRTRILLVVIILVYNVYLTTLFARTSMLYEFAVILFFITQKHIRFSVSSKKKLKWIIMAAAMVLVMLWLFNFIAQRTGKVSGSSGESWWAYYLGSQFYVFDQNILNFKGRLYGYNSLGILGRVLYKLGLMPVQNILKWQSVMAGTGNAVASFASGPYLDYGILGSLAVMAFYGIAIGYIHKRYLKTGGIWVIVYATCIFHCILAFYAFTFGGSNQVYDWILLFLMCNVRITREQGVKLKFPMA